MASNEIEIENLRKTQRSITIEVRWWDSDELSTEAEVRALIQEHLRTLHKELLKTTKYPTVSADG